MENNRKYDKSNMTDRERIINCYEDGGDWRELAESLGINKKTAYNWARRGEAEFKHRGGKQQKKLTEDQIGEIVTEVERKPSSTLKQLSEKVKTEYDVDVSVQTVYNYLHGRLITLKKAHVEVTTMNSVENKERRKSYVEKISQFMQQNKVIIWMDETNINLFCKRTQARARKGERAVKILPSCRGPNIHVIGAISPFQIIKWSRHRGAFKSETAKEWVTNMLSNLPHGLTPNNIVLVMDNAPCHSKIEECQDIFPGLIVQGLGPYFPMLNPIENIWSKMKSVVKREMVVPNVSGHAIGEQRLVFVEGLIDSAMNQITNRDCINCCQHSQRFFPAALNSEDMHPGL